LSKEARTFGGSAEEAKIVLAPGEADNTKMKRIIEAQKVDSQASSSSMSSMSSDSEPEEYVPKKGFKKFLNLCHPSLQQKKKGGREKIYWGYRKRKADDRNHVYTPP
jgi:hypothetical protein